MAPVRIWGNANGSDSKSANWKIESSEHSRDFRVAPTLWKGASPETKTAHLLSSTKAIRKCFGRNSGRPAAMAGRSSWMKRGSVFLRISKNFSGAAGQRASGPFFKNHSFQVNHAYKEKECTLC